MAILKKSADDGCLVKVILVLTNQLFFGKSIIFIVKNIKNPLKDKNSEVFEIKIS